MTITPVRLVQEGEPARHPSTVNRPMQDVLFGSDYASDGSDFAGFAKKGALPGDNAFERTMVFQFGDGSTMSTAGTRRFVSIGINYEVVAWRLRAFDGAGNPVVATATLAVHRIGWDDTLIDLVGVGTPPALATEDKKEGDPDDWTGGNGATADHVRATLVSVGVGSAVSLILSIDVAPI